MLPENVQMVENLETCGKIEIEANKFGIIGIDTEVNSIYVYQESISILQLSVGKASYIIDIMKLGLPEPIRKVLENKEILKVFQDMQFDLQMLKTEYNCEVKNIFDISIADKLIQSSSQSSNMEKLVQRYLNLNVTYSKKQQKSNWAIRPLSERQIRYAAMDVQYLCDICREQKRRLLGDFRFDWFLSFLNQIKVQVKEREYNPYYAYRMKKKFDIQDQEVLSRVNSLLISLDKCAKEIDKPSHWLLPDTQLVKIARINPKTIKEFNKLFHKNDSLIIDRKLVEIDLFNSLHTYYLIDLESPCGISTKRWVYKSKKNINRNSSRLEIIEKIKSWRRLIATEINILPEMVLNKRKIGEYANKIDEDFVIKFPGIPEKFTDLFKEDLLEYLSSNVSNITIEQF